VPVERVKRSLEHAARDGKARYAYLGVSTVELYPQLVRALRPPVEQGAWVQDVTPAGRPTTPGCTAAARDAFQARAVSRAAT
jgi:S1-C subfamily serine protease